MNLMLSSLRTVGTVLLGQAAPAPPDSALPQTPDAQPAAALEDWWASLPVDQVNPYLLDAGRVLLVIVLASLAYQMAKRAVASLVERNRVSIGIGATINKMLFWLAVAAVVFFSLQAIGVLRDAWTTLTAILAMIAIGFVAVWSVLSNTLCSVILVFARPFMVGDTIEVMGEPLKGKVIDFSLLYTTLEPEDGGVIRVPNNMFFQKAVHCMPGKRQVALDEQIGQSEPVGASRSEHPVSV